MPLFRGTGGSGESSTDAFASEVAEQAGIASTKASQAATSATNAATSATAAQTAQTAAEAAQVASEAAQNAINGLYLGAQSSNPTVDLNGSAVSAGDWYFNTSDNTTRIYDGSAWNTINPDLVGDSSPQLGGNLDLNSNNITGTGNVNITGNVVLSGTVDGRDVAADGIKLDGVEASATADQTAAEIRTLVGSASDSNVFTDADHSKLNGIEASADVTDAANVTVAGALMDSEVTNLAQVKAFDSSDYATAAQGTTADSALQNVVEDTTPQLGGDLESNGNDILFADNDKAIFGAGSDLQIYHDGNNSRVEDTGAGGLRLIGSTFVAMQSSAGEDLIKGVENGAATLYYNNAEKLATTSTGIDVTGNVDVGGELIVTGGGSGTILVNDEDSSLCPTMTFTRNGGGTTTNDFIKFENSGGEVAAINSAGGAYFLNNVGIGTNSPAHKLSVFEDSNANRTEIGIDNTDQRLVLGAYFESGVAQFATIQSTNNAETTAQNLVLQPDGGKVGIGTDSPNASLDIATTSSGVDLKLTNTSAEAASATQYNANMKTAYASEAFTLYAGDTYRNQAWIGFDNFGKEITFGTGPVGSSSERVRIDSSGNILATGGGALELVGGSTYNPSGGGTGTDTATDAGVALSSGTRIVGTNDGYIRTLLEWNTSSDITIGQTGTSMISGINLLPGTSGSVKVNGNVVLDTSRRKNFKTFMTADATVNASATYTTKNVFNTTPSINVGGFTVASSGVTVPEDGVYMVMANMVYNTAAIRTNPGFKFSINGTGQTETALSAYMRFADDHNEASSSMSTLYSLSANDVIGVQFAIEGNVGTVNLETGSHVAIYKV